MTRIFTGYANASRADQVQVAKVRRTQKRTVTVDFRAALGALQIQTILWECTAPWVTFLSAPAVIDEGKAATVLVEFNYAGTGNLKATATLGDGSVLNYEFEFTVTDAPLYPSSTYQTTNGPFSVTADLP